MGINERLVTKIHGGTGRLTGKPLCTTCSHASIIEDHITCTAIYPRPFTITKPVYNCNKYYDTNAPSLADMKDIAWELKSEKNKIGFFPPPKEGR